MDRAVPDRPDRSRRPRRRRPIAVVVTVLLVVAAVLVVVLPLGQRWYANRAPGPLRPSQAPEHVRSLSIDFGLVMDPETDWTAVGRRLDQVNATAVALNAGRVEFTAFDWAAYPEAAAEPGTDHLAVAARQLRVSADGEQREVSMIVDAFIPEWIKADPSVGGIGAEGQRAPYTASASQLYSGAVGDRLVAYVAAIGERYDPSAIEVTELFLSRYTYGPDDLALYQEMTGASDWPRNADGSINQTDPSIGTWRSQVLAQLLGRMRTALDRVRDGQGRDITLVMDVRVDWADPAAGRPFSGQDYSILLESVDVLQLWAYLGSTTAGGADRPPSAIPGLTGSLQAAGYDMSRFIVSVGLWAGPPSAEPPDRIAPAVLGEAVAAADGNGVSAVNVTPYSLMTDAHWKALARAWE
jgi:hypothetical protein